MSHPFTTIWSDEFKKDPNYPPHSPMPVSHHPVQVILHIPVDYQSPEHSGIVGN